MLSIIKTKSQPLKSELKPIYALIIKDVKRFWLSLTVGVWGLVIVLYILVNIGLFVGFAIALRLAIFRNMDKISKIPIIGEFIDPNGLTVVIVLMVVIVYFKLFFSKIFEQETEIEDFFYIRRLDLFGKINDLLRRNIPEVRYGGITKVGKSSFVRNELGRKYKEKYINDFGKEVIIVDFNKNEDPLLLLKSLGILPYESVINALEYAGRIFGIIGNILSMPNIPIIDKILDKILKLPSKTRELLFEYILFPKKGKKRKLRSEVVQELAKRFSNVGLIVVDHAVEGEIGKGYRAVLEVAENAGIKVAYVLKEGESRGIDVLHYNFNLYEMLQYIGAYLKEKNRYIKLDSGLYRLYVSNEEVPGGQGVRLMDVKVVYNDNIDLGIISVWEEDSVSSDPFGVRFSYPALNPVRIYSSKFFDFLRFIIKLQVLVDGHPALLERVLDRVSVEGVRSDGLEKIVKEVRRDLGLSLNPNDIDNEYLLVASYYRMIMLRYYVKSIEGSEAFIEDFITGNVNRMSWYIEREVSMCLGKYIKKDLHKYHHYLISPYFLPTFYLDEGSVSKCPGWVKFLDEGLLCLAIALLNPTSEVDESSVLISPEKAPAVVEYLVLIQGRIDPFVGMAYLTILANYLEGKEETPDDKRTLMRTYIVRGAIYHYRLWKLIRAIEDYDEAIRIGEELHNQYRDDKEIANDLATTYNNRGFAYCHLGEYNRAIEDYDRAIEIWEKLHNQYRDDKEIANGLAAAYGNRGLAYCHLGEYNRAIEDYDRAIEIWEKLHNQYRDDKEIANGLAKVYNNRGVAYYGFEKYNRAIEDYDRAIEIWEELHNQYPDDKEIANGLALAYNSRGLAYNGLGNRTRAIKDYDRTIEILEELHNQYPNDKKIANDLAAAYNNRGNAYYGLGDLTSACADYQKALNLFQKVRNEEWVQNVLKNMSKAGCTPPRPTSP